VKSIGNSGGFLVPKKWVGKKVKILLLEEVAEEE
jgi:putative transposon-encoded protein